VLYAIINNLLYKNQFAQLYGCLFRGFKLFGLVIMFNTLYAIHSYKLNLATFNRIIYYLKSYCVWGSQSIFIRSSTNC